MLTGHRPAALAARALLIGAVALATAHTAQGAPVVTLADQSATASFDLGSDAGMDAWTVSGTDHLSQQWFWIRVGDGPVVSVDSLGLLAHSTADTNPFSDPAHDQLSAAFGDGTVGVEFLFTLRGTSSGQLESTLGELISIVNVSDEALELSFWQYADFDLGGTVDDLDLIIDLPDSVLQTDIGVAVLEANVGPGPDHYAAAFSGSPIGLPALLDASGNLPDWAGPIGPGNLAWALQWDFALGPGQVLNISKDKVIIPEPGTGLLGLVGAVLLLRRRRP
jgi:hypothetical protein